MFTLEMVCQCPDPASEALLALVAALGLVPGLCPLVGSRPGEALRASPTHTMVAWVSSLVLGVWPQPGDRLENENHPTAGEPHDRPWF